ncbi:DUF3429 domain-containing protein [Aurantimonas sp. Leaf443]|uniref:DUF3429 domain-containing protein n=1 Tax=Aurantimonas sp. Leaf443 TaxID=1736378 RepID=UPI0006F4FF3D|nr:DUF3429 domain-containing protein [Aurantimonas sp. Leaf443]KQT85910.1 hypothetical protein ASG48_04705 [Aurantimonas sp. Leaf443]
MTETIDPAPRSAPPSAADGDVPPGPPERTAWILGLAGLVPFVLMTAALLYAGRAFIAYDFLILALSGYGAAILSFLGGIRWGAAIERPDGLHTRRALVGSVLPSLLGWAMLLVPVPYNLAGLALGFALQGLWDVRATRSGALPPWFATLRIALTVVVMLCLAASFAVLFLSPAA